MRVSCAPGSERTSEPPPVHSQGAGRIRNAAEAATATLGAKSSLGRPGERLVRWLREARRNLEQEADYLADKNPAAADAMLQIIRSSVRLLAQQPGIGRPGRVPGTRELVIQGYPYLIPYRVRGESVEILRVFHTARKPPAKW